MDWINITTRKPQIGELIWGRDPTGRARLGYYQISKETKNHVLKSANDGNPIIYDLKMWATYDVEY